jgi:hypothetical protein
MPVEFLGIAATNDGSEVGARHPVPAMLLVRPGQAQRVVLVEAVPGTSFPSSATKSPSETPPKRCDRDGRPGQSSRAGPTG